MNCDCEPDSLEDDGEESTHYVRTCALCAGKWDGLHCPHDDVQNPCPHCGWIAPGKETPTQTLGFRPRPNDQHP